MGHLHTSRLEVCTHSSGYFGAITRTKKAVATGDTSSLLLIAFKLDEEECFGVSFVVP